MPDYSKSPAILTETKVFQDWLKKKGYSWPPIRLDEQNARVEEFWRDGMADCADTRSAGATAGTALPD